MKKNWKDISLLEHIQIIDILKSDLTDLDKYVGLVSIVSEIEESEINKMNQNDFKKLLPLIYFILDDKKIEAEDIKKIYNIKGKDFLFINNPSDFNVKQFIDCLNLSKNPSDNIHKILSVVLLPVEKKKSFFGYSYIPIKEYGSYDIEEVSNYILNNISIIDANSIMVFFYLNSTILLKKYLMKMMKKIKHQINILKIKRNLGMNNHLSLAGLNQLIEYQKKLEELGKIHLK